jgi:hypothetical protein
MRHSNVAALGRVPPVGNASRRAPGKEHGARLLPEEQPANVSCLGWLISSVSRDANVVKLPGPAPGYLPGLPGVKTSPSLATEG